MAGRPCDYTIMTIGDTRAAIKADIHALLDDDWVYLELDCVDGRDKKELAAYFKQNSFVTFDGWHPRCGEAGFWGSLLNACKKVVYEGVPIVVLEDDVILEPKFIELTHTYLDTCPDDIDVFHLLTWFDRANIRAPQIDPALFKGTLVTENWHDWPFGGIVLYPSGAEKIIDYLHQNPITTVGDVWLFRAEQLGVVKAMAPAPYQTSPIAPRYANTRSLIDRTQPVHPRILPRWKPR